MIEYGHSLVTEPNHCFSHQTDISQSFPLFFSSIYDPNNGTATVCKGYSMRPLTSQECVGMRYVMYVIVVTIVFSLLFSLFLQINV